MDPDTRLVEKSLRARHVHDEWESRYRTDRIARFQDEQIDFVARRLGADDGTTVVDAGCGTATNAIRLARRGVRVHAIDFSDAVLAQARENVERAGVADLVRLERGDLLNLPLASAGVARLLVWGVLMHIPELERAVGELSRVLAAGGRLVVCEGNVRSLDEVALRALDRLGRTTSAERKPAGMERWRETPGGPLLARRADIGWLVGAFARHGVVLRERLACQLTEAYVYLPADSLLARAVHRLNAFWFHVVRSPRGASDVFLVFERPRA